MKKNIFRYVKRIDLIKDKIGYRLIIGQPNTCLICRCMREEISLPKISAFQVDMEHNCVNVNEILIHNFIDKQVFSEGISFSEYCQVEFCYSKNIGSLRITPEKRVKQK
jgi:hypothetical protein